MSPRFRIWLLAASALVFIQALASLILPHGFALVAVSDITQCILLISGTMAFLPALLSTRGTLRVFWTFMMMGIGLWLAYQLLWTYFEVILRKDVPNPFGGDVVLFLHFVPMMAAVALEVNSNSNERTLTFGSLDFSLLFTWWLYLYLFLVIPWQYIDTREIFYSDNLNLLYLTEKSVFLAAVALVWLWSTGKWKTFYAHLIGAGLTYSLSSYLANWALARGVYSSGSLYDLPLAASMAWITGVGLLGRNLPVRKQHSLSPDRSPVWVTRMGMVTVLSLPLFAAWGIFDLANPAPVRKFRLVLSLCAMLVMGGMIFFKQHLLDMELLGLLRSSRKSFQNLSRVQAQLVQSEKLASLGQLVGGAAHELNNPLTAMLGYSELLTATSLNLEQRSIVEKIVQQVRRTQNLSSSLLSFAKQAPTEKHALNLNSVVNTAIKLSQPQVQSSRVQIKLALAENLPDILGDSNQFLQISLHLITNAVQAMSANAGTLKITTWSEDASVLVEFADDGPGIDEPNRVFDPFYTTQPVGKGAGLGLSACYGIVQEHGGKITCQNRPEGGAAFRIELPAYKQHALVPLSETDLVASRSES